MITFRLYDMEIRQDKRGGGYIFSGKVTESEWQGIKDINGPENIGKIYHAVLLRENQQQAIEILKDLASESHEEIDNEDNNE